MAASKHRNIAVVDQKTRCKTLSVQFPSNDGKVELASVDFVDDI